MLDGKNFATVATLGPDGAPQTSVVWIAREGDTALFTITSDKQKARNLARDPRISVTVFDSENGYNSTEIRGTAELVEELVGWPWGVSPGGSHGTERDVK